MRPQPQEIYLKTYIGDVLPKMRYEGPYKKAVDVAEKTASASGAPRAPLIA